MRFRRGNIATFIFLVVVSPCLFPLVSSYSQVESKPNQCGGKDHSVRVSVVQPINYGQGGVLLLLEYSYDFKNQSSVFLKTIGNIPAKGSLKHLFQGESLEFLTTDAEKTLCKIVLKPNKRPSEGGADDYPSSTVFASFKSSPTTARNDSEFFERITSLLNEKNFTYRINNQNGTTSLISNYRRLDGLPNYVVGEIAVQISYPQQVTRNRFSFYVYHHARQRPRKSEEWEGVRPENQVLVDEFIASLIQRLQ